MFSGCWLIFELLHVDTAPVDVVVPGQRRALPPAVVCAAVARPAVPVAHVLAHLGPPVAGVATGLGPQVARRAQGLEEAVVRDPRLEALAARELLVAAREELVDRAVRRGARGAGRECLQGDAARPGTAAHARRLLGRLRGRVHLAARRHDVRPVRRDAHEVGRVRGGAAGGEAEAGEQGRKFELH